MDSQGEQALGNGAIGCAARVVTFAVGDNVVSSRSPNIRQPLAGCVIYHQKKGFGGAGQPHEQSFWRGRWCVGMGEGGSGMCEATCLHCQVANRPSASGSG